MDGNSYMLKGLKLDSLEVINFHCMENLLKKGHFGIIAQFHTIQAFEDDSHLVHPSFQFLLDKKNKSFNIPNDHPHVERMITTSHCFSVAYNPMCTHMVILFP